MDRKGLVNIRGTLILMEEALGYHIDDANRSGRPDDGNDLETVRDNLKNGVDRLNAVLDAH